MKLKESDRSDEFLLNQKNTKDLEFALNRILKKKYNWIKSIKLKGVIKDEHSWEKPFLIFAGLMTVDENWAKRVWEAHNSKEFPSNEHFDYQSYNGLKLNDILPSFIIDNLDRDFTHIVQSLGIYQKKIMYSKLTAMLINFENDNMGETLQETIKRVLKQETELKERCWAGYTQKGMKTMFGKRYPNCVKKKKK